VALRVPFVSVHLPVNAPPTEATEVCDNMQQRTVPCALQADFLLLQAANFSSWARIDFSIVNAKLKRTFYKRWTK
jgi:hypothetical protein